jgi:hypothetical protein
LHRYSEENGHVYLTPKEVRAEISALKCKYKFSNADLAVVGLYKLNPVVSSKLTNLNTLKAPGFNP